MSPLPHRWLHPQTVPRGFLRLYILTLLSRGPRTGYSVIQTIEERTEGAWRPGAGTVYPLLKGLVKEGLAKSMEPRGRSRTRNYLLTRKGKDELDRTRRAIAGMGQKQPAMARLFADILPPEAVVQIMLRMARERTAEFKEKASQLPKAERDSAVKEMKVLLERQIRDLEGSTPS